MTKPAVISLSLSIYLLWGPTFLAGQNKERLSTIPRVDVHAHIGDPELMKNYLELGKVLRQHHGVNLAIWIDLSFDRNIDPDDLEQHLQAYDKFQGRFLPCISDYRIADGLRYRPAQLVQWQKRGVVGYKIWVGVSDEIDDPNNDPTFTEMCRIGMLAASIHIAQPYPTSWCDDPVKFWQAQNAWERVLDRHPQLKVVNAHMLDHFNSDEQLDYLIYMLETYPNLHLDLAARFQQFHRMDRQKLRNFMIKYADRILFGTDISSQPKNGDYKKVAQSYYRAFELLETDKVINGGFFGKTPTRGLDLPDEVLEKIYYRNAAKLYPRLKETLIKLGYHLNNP